MKSPCRAIFFELLVDVRPRAEFGTIGTFHKKLTKILCILPSCIFPVIVLHYNQEVKEMNFYFNDQIDVCAEEPWVVEYLIENGFCEDKDEALYGLHSRRNFHGWFDCDVSATIEAFFEKNA